MLQHRCQYARLNQTTLRRDVLSGLLDAWHADSNVHAGSVGASVILPATITATPRFMHQLYQDALAIVRVRGAPDLFITMTCNPNWPDLRAALAGASTANRADIVSRIFMPKLMDLLHDITQRHVMGKCIGHMYVVEWQKRCARDCACYCPPAMAYCHAVASLASACCGILESAASPVAAC